MIEVAPSLYVGNELDWQNQVRDGRASVPRAGWAVLHACKHPHHKMLAGQPAPGDANYLFTIAGRRMAMNIIDVADVRFFSESMMNAGLDFICQHINDERVLVHCNQGGSRAPGLAMLYMRRWGGFRGLPFEDAEETFRGVYPNFQPSLGIRTYLVNHWDD